MDQEKKIKVGVVTLGLSLITIGSVWTINNIYPMSWAGKAIDFWPVCLIFYGLELIITKFLYQDKEGIDVTIDITIAILLIIFVMIMGGISFTKRILPYWGIYL